MGCGSSSAQTTRETHERASVNVARPRSDEGNRRVEEDNSLTKLKDNVPNTSNENGNVSTSRDLSDSSIEEKIPKLDRINTEKSTGKRKPVPKPVAFDVEFEVAPLSDKNLQSHAKRKPPRRLKALKNAPRLTEEQLQQKLAAADEKRNMALEGKRRRKDKEKQEMVKAKNLSKSQEKAKKLEERLQSGVEKREKAMAERVDRQRKRRDHEKTVREKALTQKAKTEPLSHSDNDREIETYQDSGEEHHWEDVQPKPSENVKENISVSSESPVKAQSSKDPNPLEDDFYGT